MTRIPFSSLGGVALALLLFWLLALLVAPPEEEFDVIDESLTMSMVEAPEVVEEEVAEPSAEPPPPQAEATPPPRPEPLPPLESRIAMPEPELPPEPVETPELDTSLPELSEVRPEPPPQPAPEPRPEPEPEPAPEPSPSPAAPSATPESAAEQAAPAEQGPVDVGQIAPTNRVPPEYPLRAQRRGLEGHVELQFLIRPDGSVDRSSIRVVESQPRNVFDSAAEQAVARWQFEPASGVRRARQRLEFQLR
ncbi:energy transducer TonB [Halomonas sp. MCCC 1A17488]|uniref:energy transducer TonB n=1 Tax=unclassified Halomonas TaxID=2609666 RepID=UPI0018D20F06|nr:energy transducer TonB [Halomonas sp. SS10-MC5]MCE8015635.1 energy transducer TonB [Halomonas sp. MCCC 1A17488]MCG3238968.1 energy transducer TonB [Halomonas sp. MCCC 1A17488]QPP51080.1 energy transducer TonB [Halomonas sp. SS10-MC5]